MKLHSCFLVVGTAIFFIASTLSVKGIMPCLIILKPNIQFISGEKGLFCLEAS